MKVLGINETISFETTFTQDDLDLFSKISGDNNPIHTVEYHNNNPNSKGVIVHGMLALSRFGSFLGGGVSWIWYNQCFSKCTILKTSLRRS